ncbi:terpene synthase family protein [Nannocystis punicea]|uniref:FAD-binding protein n=1 Tax=Nannocystis punicea TaxID=2995304 RepID=A0ABY7GVJ7_9BACT|nr:FAD-binding protein [Nannocystis poenicansa]WAS90983.1 FAD-binding protein [Nannocystis poenicansa]
MILAVYDNNGGGAREHGRSMKHHCNPAWDQAERQARDWAARVGLVTTDRDHRRLAKMGQGRMAGWLAPHADPGELALLAQWGAFIALVDDIYDRDSQAGPAQVDDLMDRLVAVVTHSSVDHDTSIPAVRALVDLWPRSVAGAARGWAPRFAEHYRRFADATREEARLRAGGVRLDLKRYLELRRHTITAMPVLDLIERTLPAEADALDELRWMVVDAIAWTNDLASAERELAEGADNLVGVVAREHRCDRHEAAAIVRAMLDERMDDFDDAAAALTTAGPWQAGLGPRLALLRAARDGSLAWQGETHRNRAEPSDAGGPRSVPGVDPLIRHLMPAVAADGAVRDRCASRVLETALLLSLLRATDTHPAEQELATRYLRARRPDADALDALLIDACLDPETTAPRAVAAAAALALPLSRGTGGRGQLKFAMLRVVLHLLCGAPVGDLEIPPLSTIDESTTFTEVHRLVLRIVQAPHLHAVSTGERERLLDLLGTSRNRVLWEASATTHLLGLHAVRRFRPTHRVIADGLLRLTLAQNPDGGLPFLDSQDLWLAAVAGLAFLHHARLRPLTRRMAAFVAAWQARDGGWPFASGMMQTDVDTTTRCMEFLRAADAHRYRVQLDRGAAYLVRMAGPTGGFPTWVRGEVPDLDMTAGAILALAPDGQRHRDLLVVATDFVLAGQLPDGTFERSWTLSEASAILRVVDALDAVRSSSSPAVVDRIAAAIQRAVARLAATQNHDGGWGREPDADSDVLSTAQALPVVVRHGDPRHAARALAYLLARQDPDGGFTSIPDQVGPRPLPFDFPVLADIHALTAFQRSAELTNTAALAGRTPRTGDPDWSALASKIRGVVVRPRDPAYEQGRLLVNQRFDDIRPQALVYPACVEDVAAIVRFARDRSVRLALRSGGHSYAGYSTGPGLVLDVGSLNTTSVGGGRALFGAGVKGMQAHLALAAAGAGLPLGRCPTIGLAGVTLGGGLSAFTRAWGLACDHLRSVELVTADGRIRRVGPCSEPPDDDLFWALCGGGGGNFGVVTSFEFATEVTRDRHFARFILTWPATDTAAVIRGWTHWNADQDTPRALWSAFEQLSDAGAPSLPAVTGTFIGTSDALQRALDRLVAAVDRHEAQRLITPCSYIQAASEAERWGGGAWGARVAFAAKSHIVRRPMSPAAAHDMAESLMQLHSLTGVGGASGLLIDGLGGAVGDRPADATAFPHRTAVGIVQYHSYWTALTDRAHVERRIQWLRTIHAVMQTHLGVGGYTNGMDPELRDWPAAYHGDNYSRLQRVKATVDPAQFFDFPQAITPW